MNKASISVIMPAFNVSHYVMEALASMASQVVLPDEVIIIDDGSTDDTLALVEKFQHPYPVKILSTSNQGQGSARNLGLSLASCEYVYFFDSDDLVTPDFIADMKSLAENNAFPDIVFFSGRSFYDGVDESIIQLEYGRGFDGVFESSIELLEAFRASGRFSASTCLYMSRRRLWSDASLRFIQHFHEDECILYPLVMAARRFLVTQQVYFERRIRLNSTMTQHKVPKHVQGMHATVRTLLRLNRKVRDRQLTTFIHRRMRLFLKRYVSLCRSAGTEIDLNLLVRTCLALRDPMVLAYLLYYLFDGPARGRIRRYMRAGSRG
ncbi:glycosyltransferase family 2 protein [Halomonas sp. MCCC 1A17488]|uniref:Glycosyltransferase family 2 protein n=1 Tax=Billgrantia sulfidoxydans TaxID=2733484 RepID=A0ABX7W6V2_9GAMM|nr:MULTISPECIES: glycosyltransferase family A protein [Halomonas]MCE8014722.1 glycosyltransferase family 2 protein [Halomonas sp. MCCC 1A17488]MCG3238055.1 glycosyltransferase family 2 protein [Halomonas sp. MCCC 1A17488]QPP48168.1 glycosyltransferase family 2 protein [Halomonas sp. SS10-MC5]QTP55470.1 glycosyltransferase family 2 protein [Halomonas sulfidoxydans]